MSETTDNKSQINVENEQAETINEKNVTADAIDNAAAEEENNKSSDGNAAEEEISPLEKAEKQIEELKDKYLRSVAEFDNYKKRTLKEKTELILNGGAKTVAAILPVLDDFERALADKSEDPTAIREGINNIFNKFTKTLEGLGVRKIDTADKDFDTDFHEAVAMVPGMGDDKKGKVIDCLQTGYTMNDKVIRHAKVAVGQ